MLSQRTVAGKGLAPSGRSVQPIRARGLQRARVSLNPVALFGALRQRLGQSTTQTQPREIIRRVDGVELMDWMDKHRGGHLGQQHHLVVMFTAEWCGPCALVKTELLKLADVREPGTVTVLSADVDDCKELATELGITALPMLVFVGKAEGRATICTVGPVSVSLVNDVLDNKMHLCGSDLKRRLRLV